jgi:hypothetical protein
MVRLFTQKSFIFDSDMAKLDKVKLNEIGADLEPRAVYLMFVPSYYEKWEYLAADWLAK